MVKRSSLVVLIGVAMLLCVPSAQAAIPSVTGLIVATSVSGSDITAATLTENTTTSLLAIGTGVDTDGCTQIDDVGDWSGVLYRTDVTNGASCTPDDANCYQLSSGEFTLETVPDGAPNTCDIAPDDDLGVYATTNVQFFADPTDAAAATYASTDWSYYIEANDGSDPGGATDNLEINTLLALDPSPSSINYGTIALNSASSQQTLTVTVTGNAALDVEVSVNADMTCSVRGSVPAANVEYSLSNGFSYGAGTSTSTTPATVQTDLAKPTSLTPVTDDLYLMMGLPEFGVAGSCSNTMTVTALADS